ncbi:hypothetical protein LAZ67_16000866 [Cordylochernes scorpioides]|uniref:Uncharacterized protein n=1 Tax=Cordylochernes scorpioides TaxID=51811 RepID=A0ABY6LCZ5_9ARAC|nr:hypothetical protein LAZ67_16000866 [Cordylochernes scorpioides]
MQAYKGEKEEPSNSVAASYNVNRALIRRFNHHSMMILKATLPTTDTTSQPPQKKLKLGPVEEEELAEEEVSPLSSAVPCHTAKEPYQHSQKLEYTSPDTLLTRDRCLRQEVAAWQHHRPPVSSEQWWADYSRTYINKQSKVSYI